MANKLSVNLNKIEDSIDSFDQANNLINKISFSYTKNNCSDANLSKIDSAINEIMILFDKTLSTEKSCIDKTSEKLNVLKKNVKSYDEKRISDKSIKNDLLKIKLNSSLSNKQKLKKYKSKYKKLSKLVGSKKAKKYLKNVGVNVKVASNGVVSLAYRKKAKNNTNTVTSVLAVSAYSKGKVSGGHLTRSAGVFKGPSGKETWYSQKVLPGHGLKIPGRHVANDGTIRDKDGYICVAANPKYRKMGSTLKTSLGKAKVYDTGCDYGTIDIYTNW